MRERREIGLRITLNGRQVVSETTCTWAGPCVLTIATALPDRGLAIEVHSTFVGHEGVPTCATHITLGPVGRDPVIAQVEHDRASLAPTLRARDCACEHVQTVLETLKGLGCKVAIGVPDNAFAELARVER